jgi:hypothetical protein
MCTGNASPTRPSHGMASTEKRRTIFRFRSQLKSPEVWLTREFSQSSIEVSGGYKTTETTQRFPARWESLPANGTTFHDSGLDAKMNFSQCSDQMNQRALRTGTSKPTIPTTRPLHCSAPATDKNQQNASHTAMYPDGLSPTAVSGPWTHGGRAVPLRHFALASDRE